MASSGSPAIARAVTSKPASANVPRAQSSPAALAPGSPGYAAAFCAQAAFYALALYGARLDRRERPAPARGEAFREAA